MKRIGIDVGGTFTDVVLLDESGRVHTTKVPTTPRDRVVGAINGFRRILEIAGCAPGDVGFVGHGSTMATNMVVEGTGAPTALIATAGFRDLLELRRIARHDRADLYDLQFDNPKPLVPRRWRYEAPERLDWRGNVEQPLDEAALHAICDRIAKTEVQAVAVSFLHAAANPVHEKRAAAILAERLPGRFLSLSHEVNPEIGEYERTSTTVMNAMLGPLCARYIAAFQDGLREEGFRGELLFMGSNGGLADAALVAARPVLLLESGPAGGVSAAIRLGERHGWEDAILGDMGGTTFDVSLVRGRRAELRSQVLLHTYAVRAPSIDIESIGAGGGSIAWVDAGGGVRIGPHSAAADPGPACYGRGGTRPTVTDCNLILGHIDPETFLDGRFRLDREAAERAVQEHLATPLKLPVMEAAHAVRAVANALMAQAIRLMTVERGHDPRGIAYLCFGGAGPVHALDLARELEMGRVLVPPAPGLFSALGMVLADRQADRQAAVDRPLDACTQAGLEARFGVLEAATDAALPRDPGIERSLRRRADCRYAGQPDSIMVDIPSCDPAAIRAAFEEVHRRLWNFTKDDQPVLLNNIRVEARAETGWRGPLLFGAPGSTPKPHRTRHIHLAGEVPVWRRAELPEGFEVYGPAVIEEASSSLVLGVGDVARADAGGVLAITLGARVMDIVTYEILRSSLFATAREMKLAMMRTAGSPIVHSGGDASAAVFDAEMQLVAQGNDIPTMLGSAVISTKASVEAIGRERLRPGDVIVSNDVYLGGGNHQPDVQFTRPVFVDGEIVAFVMTRGHWSDIGGQLPGSYTTLTWDVFAEGIRIPPVLLYRDDQPVQDLVTLVLQNTRDPAVRLLDMQAQYAGCVVGDRRITAIARRYGKQALADAMRRALDHSERLMREALRAIPDGTYEAEDEIEPVNGPAGWSRKPVPIRVRITKQGDGIHFDYAGSGPQQRGGINCPFAVTCNSTWFTVKAITDVSIPINQGCYRPVSISAPEGSIVNCRFPASVVAGNTETSPRLIDLLLKALAPAIPDRVVGQSNCGAYSGIFGGMDPDGARVAATGRPYVGMIDPHAGGMGARATKDGVNGVRVYVGNAGSSAVEIIEQTAPVKVEEWSLVPDTGGAGTWRGGLTARRVYRVRYEEATFTVCGERGIHPPLGQFGGGAGSVFRCEVEREGEVTHVPAKGSHEIVHAGDRVLLQPAGSGGYGDPRKRDRARLLDDLRDGYVTPESLTRDYGLSEADAKALVTEMADG